MAVAVVAADTYQVIPILKDDRTQNAYGEYSFDFETGNGISRNEQGYQQDGQENSGAWRWVHHRGIRLGKNKIMVYEKKT